MLAMFSTVLGFLRCVKIVPITKLSTSVLSHGGRYPEPLACNGFSPLAAILLPFIPKIAVVLLLPPVVLQEFLVKMVGLILFRHNLTNSILPYNESLSYKAIKEVNKNWHEADKHYKLFF